jgi:hypothetical protein
MHVTALPLKWGTECHYYVRRLFLHQKIVNKYIINYYYPPHLVFSNVFSLSQCLRSTYEYTRPNLYDAQFGYFGHLQMI